MDKYGITIETRIKTEMERVLEAARLLVAKVILFELAIRRHNFIVVNLILLPGK